MNGTSVYLAGRYSRKNYFRLVADRLRHLGIQICTSWLDEPEDSQVVMSDVTDDRLLAYAKRDLDDIREANVFLFFSEDPLVGIPRGGRHVEFGYALAKNKHILVVGPHENIFHYLPLVVEHFEEVDKAIKRILEIEDDWKDCARAIECNQPPPDHNC